MIRAFIISCLMFAFLPSGAWAVDACAGKAAITIINPGPNQTSTLDYCNCLMYPNGTTNNPNPAVSVPIIQCLTDTTLVPDAVTGNSYPRGLIPYSTYHILKDTTLVSYFKPIMASLLSLALALYGYGLFIGSIRSVKQETFLIALKFAGIYWFLYSGPDFYLQMLNVITQLCDAIASGAATLGTEINANDHFWANCAVDPVSGAVTAPSTSMQMWGMWDCTLNYLLGFSGASVKWIGIVFFAMAMMATMGTGITIGGLIIGMIIGLLLLFARFIQTYVLAILALSFMFIIGYLFIPLVLFKHEQTRTKFEKWLSMCLGYTLTPVIMMGYMCMMLLSLDIVLFTGSHSLFEKIQYNSSQAVYTTDAANSPLLTASKNTQDSFVSYAQMDYASNVGLSACSTGTDPASPTGKMVGPTGIFGATRFLNIDNAGTQSELQMPASTNRLGFRLRGLNIGPCDASSTQAHQTPPGCTYQGTTGTGLAELYNGGIPQWQWVAGVLQAAASGLILIYVMYAVLGYLPSLIDGLVAQGTGAGLLAQTTRGTGEDAGRSVIDAATSLATKGGGAINKAASKAVGK